MAKHIQKGGGVHGNDHWLLKVLQVFFEWVTFALTSWHGDKGADAQKAAQMSGGSYKPLSPLQQDAVKRLEEKASKTGFEANVRVVICSRDPVTAQSHMRNVLSSFMQYTQSPFNGLSARVQVAPTDSWARP